MPHQASLLRHRPPASIFRGLLLLVTAIGITSGGCDLIRSESDPAPEKQILLVETRPATLVEQTTVTDIFFGKLIPVRKARLSFQQAGMVRSVSANLGDQAAAGAELASISPPMLAEQIKQLKEYIAGLQQSVSASPPAEATSINQQIQTRQNQLAGLERQQAASQIVAPYDCLIAARGVDEGDAVSPSIAAFQVIEDKQPKIETQLPRDVVRQLEQGAVMSVQLEGMKYPLKLLRRSPEVNAAAGVKTVLSFSETLPRRLWDFGSVVELQLVSQQKTAGYEVPVSALVSPGDGVWSVMVAVRGEDNSVRIARRLVTILQADEDTALVTGSLSQGEAVVVRGAHRVVPGQQVRTGAAEPAQEPAS